MIKKSYKKVIALILIALMTRTLIADQMSFFSAVETPPSMLLDENEKESSRRDQYLPEYSAFKHRAARDFVKYFDSLFRTQYAPLKWKQKRYNWDLDKERYVALAQLLKIETFDRDNLKPIFSRFADSSHDVHVGVVFEDPRVGIIPLTVDWIDEKVIVTNSSYSSIHPGDEIVSVNSEAPLDHLKQVCYGSKDISLTRPHFFLSNLFYRIGSQMPVPSEADLIVGIKTPEGELKLKSLHWYISNQSYVESLCGYAKRSSRNSKIKTHFALHDIPLKHPSSHSRNFAAIAKAYGYEALAEQVDSEEKDELEREIFVEEGVCIGYIKIPNFSDLDFAKIDEAVVLFQEKADALVVDLRGNPGGYDMSAMGLASRLIENPLVNLMNSYILDEATVENSREIFKEMQIVIEYINNGYDVCEAVGEYEIEGLTVSSELVRALYREALTNIEEWENGYTCSRFEPLRGLDTINPHPKNRYTKPLYILIDERCASAADVFPALMKDNNRAVLLGRTTSGAGGTVETLPITNAFGVKELCITTSFFLRNNMMAIEDVGVSPHFENKKTLRSVTHRNEEKDQAIKFAAQEILKSMN